MTQIYLNKNNRRRKQNEEKRKINKTKHKQKYEIILYNKLILLKLQCETTNKFYNFSNDISLVYKLRQLINIQTNK